MIGDEIPTKRRIKQIDMLVHQNEYFFRYTTRWSTVLHLFVFAKFDTLVGREIEADKLSILDVDERVFYCAWYSSYETGLDRAASFHL